MSTSADARAGSVRCFGDLRHGGVPVLLVHGTGVTAARTGRRPTSPTYCSRARHVHVTLRQPRPVTCRTTSSTSPPPSGSHAGAGGAASPCSATARAR